jgi:hypothetical protein
MRPLNPRQVSALAGKSLNSAVNTTSSHLMSAQLSKKKSSSSNLSCAERNISNAFNAALLPTLFSPKMNVASPNNTSVSFILLNPSILKLLSFR